MNHKQLTFAREYRGLTQTQLSRKIDGLSQSNLSKFEKGLSTLSDDLIQKIVALLNFPEEFFNERISIVCENAQYRKKATITKWQKSSLDYKNKLIGYIVDQMSNSIEWPEFSLHPLDLEENYTPESVAKHTRKLLRIREDEPVKNIFSLLESKGIIILEIDVFEKFDGVSFMTDNGFPVIVINGNYSNDRKRFTVAHELGHVIMHLAGNFPIPDHRDEKVRENEANRFTSEFLMPSNAIKNSLRNLKMSSLVELKKYWLCSMASIIRRAYDLKCIDKNRYTYLYIELSRSGQKKKELTDVPIDTPKSFKAGYLLHKNELNYSIDELARAFNLPTDIIRDICESKHTNRNKLKVVI